MEDSREIDAEENARQLAEWIRNILPKLSRIYMNEMITSGRFVLSIHDNRIKEI